MAKDELQQHLDKGRYGSPRINPEEQRKYLGTFRERCFVSMTIREMKNNQDRHYLIEEIKKHPEGKLLINGAVPDTLQSEFIGLASKNAADFTIINDATVEDEESIGVLLVTDHAVNEEIIDIEKNILQRQRLNLLNLSKRKAFLGAYLIKEN